MFGRWGLVPACAMMAFAAPSSAQVARLDVLADTVMVGQPFRVLLTVRPPAGAFPLIPAPPAGARPDTTALSVGDARVLAFERRPPHVAGRLRIDSAYYEVAVFSLDSARVGPMDLQLVAGTDTLPVRASGATVMVRPATTEADSLRPAAAPLDMPRAWGPWALALGAVIVGIAVAARAIAARRRRPARTSPHAHLPPYAEALARLEALAAVTVDSDASAEAHHVELSDTIRTYLERSIGLDAHRLTTAGLAAALAQRGVPADVRDALSGILRETDMVKFAARRPGAADLAAARTRTREGLEGVEGWRGKGGEG